MDTTSARLLFLAEYLNYVSFAVPVNESEEAKLQFFFATRVIFSVPIIYLQIDIYLSEVDSILECFRLELNLEQPPGITYCKTFSLLLLCNFLRQYCIYIRVIFLKFDQFVGKIIRDTEKLSLTSLRINRSVNIYVHKSKANTNCKQQKETIITDR